jgi:parallel beta-helix repeat protein
VRTSTNVKIQGNTSSNNSAWGVNLMRTQTSEISGNATVDNVRRCTWGAGTVGFGCDAGGIAIQDGSNGILIANNTVTGKNGNGIFIKAHAMPCGNNNTIVNNTIRNVLYNAVELGFCTGNKVNNNTISGGLDAIWMGFSQNTEIKGNSINGMSNHGIISGNSHNNIVSGNTVVSSNEGLYFFTDDYDRVAFGFLQPGDYKSHDNCLCSNTLQSNNIAVHLKDSTNNQISSNVFQGNQRTILMQGNSGGNRIQNNTGWLSFPLSRMVARLSGW